MDYEPNTVSKGFLAYQRLEKQRIRKLGLNETYSRYYLDSLASSPRSGSSQPSTVNSFGSCASIRDGYFNSVPSNTIAPFATRQKPTCGCYFSDRTDNKRRQFGICPINVDKARYKFPGLQMKTDWRGVDNIWTALYIRNSISWLPLFRRYRSFIYYFLIVYLFQHSLLSLKQR